MNEALDMLREWTRILEEMPPRVARAYASHSVPYGRVYRMWTTEGEMIAYINQGEVADLPRSKKPDPYAALFGIPVFSS